MLGGPGLGDMISAQPSSLIRTCVSLCLRVGVGDLGGGGRNRDGQSQKSNAFKLLKGTVCSY